MKHRTARAMTMITEWLGAFPAFLVALAIVLVWLVGLLFGMNSDGYQLLINTGTTIITFLMVFIIQNTTNRESRALHTKMDAVLTNQRTMSRMLEHMAGNDPDVAVLADELMGLEDKPADEIKSTQTMVRNA